MIINQNTTVTTNKITLVPYEAHHVSKYHEWMQDPDIQAATSSEPLTLSQEYTMQRSWRADKDKLTFITCFPFDLWSDVERGSREHEINAMLGDVNMFILAAEEDDGSESLIGEIEIMIANKMMQRRGHGRTALLTFLKYVLGHERELLAEYGAASNQQHFDYLRVKIKESNLRSINLFESIGFVKTETTPNWFEEFELRCLGLTERRIEEMMVQRKIEGYEELKHVVRGIDGDKDMYVEASSGASDSFNSGASQQVRQHRSGPFS